MPDTKPETLIRPAVSGRFVRAAVVLAAAALLAAGAAGCGNDENSADRSLPPAPKLSIPDGSVEPSKKKSSGSTDATGDTGDSTTSGGNADSGADTGAVAPQQNTGGQGTAPAPDSPAPPQDTGGAAPGN